MVDDWRGHRCDIDFQNPTKIESTDGLFSHSTTAYSVEKQGSGFVVKGMQVKTMIKNLGRFRNNNENCFLWSSTLIIITKQRFMNVNSNLFS